MSELQHTPGPWSVQVYESLEDAHDDGGFDWADKWDSDRLGRPACVWQGTPAEGCTGLPGCVETTEGNARLIAAAPDLLAACGLMLAILEQEYGVACKNGYFPAVLPALEHGRAALAKAKGDTA